MVLSCDGCFLSFGFRLARLSLGFAMIKLARCTQSSKGNVRIVFIFLVVNWLIEFIVFLVRYPNSILFLILT